MGNELTLDNTNSSAVQYSHKHQMPGDDFDRCAGERNGIQLLVPVKVNGSERAQVKAGEIQLR